MPGAASPYTSYGTMGDLGLGDMLGQQAQDETDEEKRRKQRGLATTGSGNAVQDIFGFGPTGVAPVSRSGGYSARGGMNLGMAGNVIRR